MRRRRRDSGGAERKALAPGSCKEPNSWKPKINLNGESIRSGEWVNWGKQQQGGKDGAADEVSMQENPLSNESTFPKSPFSQNKAVMKQKTAVKNNYEAKGSFPPVNKHAELADQKSGSQSVGG